MTRLNSGRAERKENEAEECLHSLRGVCNTLHAQFPRVPSRPQTRRTREVRRTWDGKRRLYDHCASLFLSYVCRVYVSIQTTREPALGSESVLIVIRALFLYVVLPLTPFSFLSFNHRRCCANGITVTSPTSLSRMQRRPALYQCFIQNKLNNTTFYVRNFYHRAHLGGDSLAADPRRARLRLPRCQSGVLRRQLSPALASAR